MHSTSILSGKNNSFKLQQKTKDDAKITQFYALQSFADD